MAMVNWMLQQDITWWLYKVVTIQRTSRLKSESNEMKQASVSGDLLSAVP